MSLEARKEKEADAEMAAAAKCLKTGMFSRWKPDWEEAAAHYEKAATSYRVAKALPKAMDAYAKASEAHTNMDSDFMAAKHLETAAVIARDNAKDPAQAATYFEMASKIHAGAGSVDPAAEALSKAAKAVEETDPARGVALLVSACELFDDVEEASRLLTATEIFKTAVSYHLRTLDAANRGARLGAAASLLQRQAALHARLDSQHAVARCELSAVVVRLAADDFEGALASHERAVGTPAGYAASDEAFAASALLDAYTSQSEEALKACTTSQMYNFLENQVTRVAKSLTLRSAGVPVGRLTTATATAGVASMALEAPTSAEEATGDFGEVAPEDEAPTPQQEEEIDLC